MVTFSIAHIERHHMGQTAAEEALHRIYCLTQDRENRELQELMEHISQLEEQAAAAAAGSSSKTRRR